MRTASHTVTAPLPPRCGGSRSAPGKRRIALPARARYRAGRALRYAEDESLGDRLTALQSASHSVTARLPLLCSGMRKAPGQYRIARSPTARTRLVTASAARAALCAARTAPNRLCCCRWTLPSQPPPTVDSAVIPPIPCRGPAQAPPGRLRPAGPGGVESAGRSSLAPNETVLPRRRSRCGRTNVLSGADELRLSRRLAGRRPAGRRRPGGACAAAGQEIGGMTAESTVGGG